MLILKRNLLPKKVIIRNLIITLVAAFILLLFDQLTKNLIFTNKEYEEGFINNELVINWKIIGFRPLFHHGVTSGLQNIFGFWLIHFFSILMIIIVFVAIFFVKDVMINIALAILLAGNLGNMIDRILYDNQVKDLFFLPYHDNGTFNFADIFIVFGAALVPVSIFSKYLWQKFRNWKKEKSKIGELKIDE